MPETQTAGQPHVQIMQRGTPASAVHDSRDDGTVDMEGPAHVLNAKLRRTNGASEM